MSERDPVFEALLRDNDRTLWITICIIVAGFVPAFLMALAS